MYQALAACGAVLVTFVGVCHEVVGHIIFPWGPDFLGGPIGWHATGVFAIGSGLLVLAGSLQLIRFPVVPFALVAFTAGLGVFIATAVMHREFHMFALTTALSGAVIAFCYPRSIRHAAGSLAK